MEKEENKKECMYSQDHYTDKDRAVLCDGCEIECKFNKNGGTNDKQGILDEIKSLAMQHSGLTEFNSGYKNAVNDIISLIAPIFEEPRFKYNENGYSRFENKLIEFRNNTPLISVNYRQGKGVGIIKRYAYELLKIAEESIIKEPASEMWHDNKEMPSDKRILAIDCNGIPYVGYSGGINPNMVDRWVNFDNFINFANSVAKIKEKSVSEELEQAVDNYLANYFGGEKEKQDRPFLKKMAIHFANWQKEKDIDEIRIIRELLENFDKTCDEYHDAGFKHGQEALMKDAVSGYWIARDKNVARPLNIFEEKPEREHLNDGRQYWKGDFHDSICLPSTLFPEIQWEDEPQKVKLKIIKDE